MFLRKFLAGNGKNWDDNEASKGKLQSGIYEALNEKYSRSRNNISFIGRRREIDLSAFNSFALVLLKMLWLSHGSKLVKVCINSINLSLWISSTCQTFLRNVFFRGVLDNDIDWFLIYFFLLENALQ